MIFIINVLSVDDLLFPPFFFKLPLTSKKEPLMNPSVAQAKPYSKNVAFWFFGMPKTSDVV